MTSDSDKTILVNILGILQLCLLTQIMLEMRVISHTRRKVRTSGAVELWSVGWVLNKTARTLSVSQNNTFPLQGREREREGEC